MMNMNQLMKQAQAMQKKISDMQEKIANEVFEGAAGGGAIKISITGNGEMSSIKIDPELLVKEEVEILEDLIIAACNDARKKLNEQTEGSFGGLLPPGVKLPF